MAMFVFAGMSGVSILSKVIQSLAKGCGIGFIDFSLLGVDPPWRRIYGSRISQKSLLLVRKGKL